MKKHHYKLDTDKDHWGRYYFGYKEETLIFKCTECWSTIYIQRSTFNSFVNRNIPTFKVRWPTTTGCSAYMLYGDHVLRRRVSQ